MGWCELTVSYDSNVVIFKVRARLFHFYDSNVAARTPCWPAAVSETVMRYFGFFEVRRGCDLSTTSASFGQLSLCAALRLGCRPLRLVAGYETQRIRSELFSFVLYSGIACGLF